MRAFGQGESGCVTLKRITFVDWQSWRLTSQAVAPPRRGRRQRSVAYRLIRIGKETLRHALKPIRVRCDIGQCAVKIGGRDYTNWHPPPVANRIEECARRNVGELIIFLIRGKMTQEQWSIDYDHRNDQRTVIVLAQTYRQGTT